MSALSRGSVTPASRRRRPSPRSAYRSSTTSLHVATPREETLTHHLAGRVARPAGPAPPVLSAQAKRYLVAVEPGYAETLSPASVASLRVQGGPMTAAEAERFAAHPWAADAVRLRRCDDLAKVPGGPEADLDDLLERYRRASDRR